MTLLWRNATFRENAIVATAFLVLVHLLYGGTVQAGFVTDFTGLQARLDGASFWGFLDCFGFPAMHQVTNFFLYFFYKFFGTNPLPWYFIFTSLHVVNGVLGYQLGKKIFHLTPGSSPRGEGCITSPLSLRRGAGGEVPAFAASLLFLLSPYAAEVVVWKVCFNFLFSTLCVLGSLLLLIDFWEKGERRSLWWSHGLFAVGLFTFELAVVLPLLAVCNRQIYLAGSPREENQPNKFGGYVALTHIAILAAYFALNKLLLGGWVGHYGEGVHLKFDSTAIAANLLKYFSKYLTLWRDWPHPAKASWMDICDSEMTGWVALAIGIAVVLSGAFFMKKMSGKLRTAWLCWLLFFIALLPVANLYVSWLLHGENDRYGYLASLFFYMGLVALLYFLPKTLRYGLLVGMVAVSIFYLQKNTARWQHSAAVVNSLLDDFRWQNAPEVYVLAMPENYEGIPMFKDFSGEDLALRDALRYGPGKQVDGKIFQIAQFNLATTDDGVSVQVDSTNHFHVTFDQWGNWWWRNGIGTGSYSTEGYEFEAVERGSKIWVKNPAEGAVFIFSQGSRWECRAPDSSYRDCGRPE